MKKLILIPFVLFTLFLSFNFPPQEVEAMTPNSNCTYDSNKNPICPQWDPAPNFCIGGTILSGEINECGCIGAPTCIIPSPEPTTDPVACTKELKTCPDGSGVGRIGPNCEFAPCPSPKPTYNPTPTPTPTPTTQQFCQTDANCSSDEFCYQPPMPVCPSGMACPQVMPPKYCKSKETATNNKVSFATPYAKLSADDFYIDVNGTKFLANDPNITVHSDPGSDIYTTLEITWNENNVEMRMFIYFTAYPNNTWAITEIRTYNGQNPGNWLYYGGTSGRELGEALVLNNYNLTTPNQPTGKIHFENLSIQPFLDVDHKPPSEFGYYIEKKPVEDIEVFLMGPYHGYGVNAVLRDSNNQVITDQSLFHYVWTSLDTSLLTVTPQTTNNAINSPDGCFYGVSKPCPYSNAQISFHGIGTTKVKVQVMNSSNQEVASEEFTFTIKQKSADLNRDGKVNIMDYTILSSQFMRTDYPLADINADGKVNLMDFTIMMGQFNPNFALP